MICIFYPGVDVVLEVLRVTADECKAEFKELKLVYIYVLLYSRIS